jgi:uncharacterized protein
VTLLSHPQRLAICRLDPRALLPKWLPESPFHSVTRTPHELSIVCEDGPHIPDEVRREGDWRILEVQGPLPFTAVGILAALTENLAAAGVSVFVLSTFDTDYVLVKDAQFEHAMEALCACGHTVRHGPGGQAPE